MNTLHLKASTCHSANINLPGSKSISNRILLLAALAENICEIHNLLDSDDTQYMLKALKTLGIKIEQLPADSEDSGLHLRVYGCKGKFPQQQADLFLGNAGTAFRPLTAVLAILGGEYYLHGVARMHERPIGDLVDALQTAGATIEYKEQIGFPPLQIHRARQNTNYHISVKGNVSSQFLTALLMALPLTGKAYTIDVCGELISKPYIAITLKLLEQFGIQISHQDFQTFQLAAGQHYHAPAQIYVEGDASSASYFLAAGLISGKPVRINGIDANSIQGDIAFAHELEKIGAQIFWGEQFIEISRSSNQNILPFDIDANHIPDAAMTLAIVALASKGTCHIRNIASWRVKETDRISAMTAELRKLGAHVIATEDSISITPPAKLQTDVHISTYDDHRMAMCFSLVSLLGTSIYIDDPQCVNKTFPEYFKVFASMCTPV
ncbi:3-phosphoshikimate 1-carboxyvinyltransferase [Snodgrassella gandavensis]|uniref:3-phosphoshikimate 1-carboxyvinyltransferase n=1 Tax=Snodgrassella gandavensis TaxID=2946698 RepID=UPI001EF736B9|nr:3-phosphoshikimate 1-carboxyvinyltransferase [Snodgrassella gandavensis]